MNMVWHLVVDDVGRPGAHNMAIDYSLLQRAQSGHAFLRIYRWDPACISFGRNEPALKRYDREAIGVRGMDTVRRPTGGRAVWHENEVTYAVAAPLMTFGSLPTTYTAIHKMLASALNRLGANVVHADAARNTEALSAGACFASPVGGEILADGAKLVGSAQLRENESFLQHGSILLGGSQDVIDSLGRNTRTAPTKATSLTAVLGREITFRETCAAITQQARDDWPGHWNGPVTSPAPDSLFSFDDSAWTWRR